MHEQNIYKKSAILLLLTVLAIALCRVTNGYFTPVIALIGVLCAFANQLGWALVIFVLMPFFVILNPLLFPKENVVVGYSLRFAPLLIGFILALRGASREGHHRLPFFWIIPFLMAAVISSIDGWAPFVSFLKLVNFVMFLFGIWFGTQNLQHRPKDVFLLRCFFFALSALLVLGSIAVMPVPSIAYGTSLRYAMAEGGVELANDKFLELQAKGAKTLFCGITNHSQALAPLLVCTLIWTLCDMLFVERRFRWGHVLLLGLTLPLLYLTRSRVALVSFLFAGCIVVFYTARRIRLPPLVRRHLGHGMLVAGGGVVILAVIAQIRGGILSEWIRKTSDVEADKRTLSEALTASRKGLMEYSLYEFRRSPFVGSGFQVAEYTQDYIQGTKGLVISASVEKGVLPVMVLGETGILGSVLFLLFIFTFYGICARHQYYITISMFSVFLMTNMGEATFFSPGGTGGILWMICVVGGFSLDTFLLYRQNILNAWEEMGIQMAAPAWEEVEDRSGRRRVVESRREVKRYGLKDRG